MKILSLLLMRSIAILNSHPSLRLKLTKLTKFFGLHSTLKNIYYNQRQPYEKQNTDVALDDLTPYARSIYGDLQSSIAKHRIEQ